MLPVLGYDTEALPDAALHAGPWPDHATEEPVLNIPLVGFTYTLLDANGIAVLSGNSTADRTVLYLRQCAPDVYRAVAMDLRGSCATGEVVVVK